MDFELSLLATGAALPSKCVASEDYDQRFAKTPGWTATTTGVLHRHFVMPGETASSLAERACREALSKTNSAAHNLSSVIGASGVMEQAIPGFAVLLHQRLGLPGSTAAFDVNATCLSFLLALRTAALAFHGGERGPILLASADIASAALNPDDPNTAPLFGDGAAAAIVARGAGRLKAWRMETYSDGAQSTWLGAGGSRLPARDLDALLAEAHFRMDGAAAYRIAAKHMPPFIDHLLGEAGWTWSDVDLVIPHQASGHALELMRRKFDIPEDKLINILATHGNQVAASLPSALHAASAAGRLKPGTRVLMIGTGAGISIAGAAWQMG